MRARRTVVLPIVALLVTLLAACGTIPADPEGTLDRVRQGVLLAGATPHDHWVRITEGRPGGTEPDLVEAFADELGAEVEWMVGSEAELVTLLEHGDLDLVVGGFDETTPWSSRAGTTMPYSETLGRYDATHRHVMLVGRGENAFLLELDRFLQREGGTP